MLSDRPARRRLCGHTAKAADTDVSGVSKYAVVKAATVRRIVGEGIPAPFGGGGTTSAI